MTQHSDLASLRELVDRYRALRERYQDAPPEKLVAGLSDELLRIHERARLGELLARPEAVGHDELRDLLEDWLEDEADLLGGLALDLPPRPTVPARVRHESLVGAVLLERVTAPLLGERSDPVRPRRPRGWGGGRVLPRLLAAAALSAVLIGILPLSREEGPRRPRPDQVALLRRAHQALPLLEGGLELESLDLSLEERGGEIRMDCVALARAPLRGRLELPGWLTPSRVRFGLAGGDGELWQGAEIPPDLWDTVLQRSLRFPSGARVELRLSGQGRCLLSEGGARVLLPFQGLSRVGRLHLWALRFPDPGPLPESGSWIRESRPRPGSLPGRPLVREWSWRDVTLRGPWQVHLPPLENASRELPMVPELPGGEAEDSPEPGSWPEDWLLVLDTSARRRAHRASDRGFMLDLARELDRRGSRVRVLTLDSSLLPLGSQEGDLSPEELEEALAGRAHLGWLDLHRGLRSLGRRLREHSGPLQVVLVADLPGSREEEALPALGELPEGIRLSVLAPEASRPGRLELGLTRRGRGNLVRLVSLEERARDIPHLLRDLLASPGTREPAQGGCPPETHCLPRREVRFPWEPGWDEALPHWPRQLPEQALAALPAGNPEPRGESRAGPEEPSGTVEVILGDDRHLVRASGGAAASRPPSLPPSTHPHARRHLAPRWSRGPLLGAVDLEQARARVAARPRNRGAREELCLGLAKREDWSGLLSAARSWLAALPASVRVYEYLGWARAGAGDPVEAWRYWSTVLELAPDDVGLWSRVGFRALATGQTRIAGRLFREALERAPRDSRLLLGRSLLEEDPEAGRGPLRIRVHLDEGEMLPRVELLDPGYETCSPGSPRTSSGTVLLASTSHQEFVIPASRLSPGTYALGLGHPRGAPKRTRRGVVVVRGPGGIRVQPFYLEAGLRGVHRTLGISPGKEKQESR